MPCCDRQPFADFCREVADGADGSVRLEHAGQVADIALAAGGAQAGGQAERLAADVAGLLGFALAA